jgi:ribulose-phosphate 3-epimerase
MPTICPTITAYTKNEYHEQMGKIVHLSHRVQIDLTDGEFTKEKTVLPEDAWWPVGFAADFHLMYKDPIPAIHKLLEHKPNLIIVHAEAEGNFSEIANLCHSAGVRVGSALLQDTPVEVLQPVLAQLDHVLIFSGNLGYQGGSQADIRLLDKVGKLKSTKPAIEIGWDGGVSDQNIAQLILGGVDVLNVGGFLQSADNPEKSFHALQRIADETGTT